MEDKDIFNQIDEGMIEFFINANLADIESMLLEEGMDLNRTKDKRQKFAKKIKFLAKAKLNQQNDENLLERAIKKLENAFRDKKDKPIAFLRQHIEQRGLAFQFRNLDKLDVEDIREILNELDLVTFMEDLENQENIDSE